MSLGRRLTAEGVGTALLLAGVVGSGIMGERLAAGNVALALLANTLATAAVLAALIVTFGPYIGAAYWFTASTSFAKTRAFSAGTEPAEFVHPEVVEVMREAGMDLSAAQPRRLTPALASQAALLVTMGCGDACPFVPGLQREEWNLADPKGQPPERVRAIRDEIRVRVERLIATRGWRTPDF